MKYTHDDIKEFAARYTGRRIYGIPKSGSILAGWMAYYNNSISMVARPEEADVIVDDIYDSGKTAERYIKYGKEMTYLCHKPEMGLDEWVHMPWDSEETNDAEDIAVRLLQYIGEDASREGLLETPKRFLKAWNFWASGYGKDYRDVFKVFEDGAENCDEMVVVKEIPVFSHCEHHIAPIIGMCVVAYIPNGKIAGLSKFVRLVEVFARRLQVQERLTNQIANAIEETLEPLGVGVIIKARHLCMESRGVERVGAETVTCALRGVIKEEPRARAEFLSFK